MGTRDFKSLQTYPCLGRRSEGFPRLGEKRWLGESVSPRAEQPLVGGSVKTHSRDTDMDSIQLNTSDPGGDAIRSRPLHQRESSNDSIRPNVGNLSRSQTPAQSGPLDPNTMNMSGLTLEQPRVIGAQASPQRGRGAAQQPPSPTSSKRRASPGETNADVQGLSRTAQNSNASPLASPRHVGKRPKSDPDHTHTNNAGREQQFSRGKPRTRDLFDPNNPSRALQAHPPNTQPKVFSNQVGQPSNPTAAATVSAAPFFDADPRGPPRAMGVLELPPQVPWDMVLQPDARPISHEQLAAEVKGIYAGLVMVEAKCINIDNAQMTALREANPGKRPKMGPEQWQALVTLHRTLLYEHHDFLLASQHPSSSPALNRLAAKYSMPARMWKHAIHSFLEVLRHHMPKAIDYMLHFIYLAYSMMALLYETVPAFEDTWIECLGDLARYRMAIEEEDMRDRETWGGVARFWYGKASDKNPGVGRLYHHLGILARPSALQQLYFYSRSLTSIQPFYNARESATTLFEPLLSRAQLAYPFVHGIDAIFVKLHALMFEGRFGDEFDNTKKEHLTDIDGHIGRTTAKWKEQGVFTAVANIAAFFQYGAQDDRLRQSYDQTYQPPQIAKVESEHNQDDMESITRQHEHTLPEALPTHLPYAADVTFSIFSVALRRIGDRNVLPHIHVLMVFVRSLSFLTDTAGTSIHGLLQGVPWVELAHFLNTLSRLEPINERVQSAGLGGRFLRSDGDTKPLPEDYLIRGMVWCQSYFEAGWFDTQDDEEGRLLELTSTNSMRAERVLWLGIAMSTVRSI